MWRSPSPKSNSVFANPPAIPALSPPTLTVDPSSESDSTPEMETAELMTDSVSRGIVCWIVVGLDSTKVVVGSWSWWTAAVATGVCSVTWTSRTRFGFQTYQLCINSRAEKMPKTNLCTHWHETCLKARWNSMRNGYPIERQLLLSYGLDWENKQYCFLLSPRNLDYSDSADT